MYCTNCGKLVNTDDMVCKECKVPFGCGQEFCRSCGGEIKDGGKKCAHCGAKLSPSLEKSGQAGEKSRQAAVVLAFLLGSFGAHNFYLGFKGYAITQLVLSLTIILFPVSFFWGIIDGAALLCGKRSQDALGFSLRK